MKSFWNNGSKVLLFLIFVCSQCLVIFAVTDSNDLAALLAVKSSWKNVPQTWVGGDPCGGNWGGVSCNDTRVTSLSLADRGLQGSGLSDITSLSELQTLDLSNNVGLTGTLSSIEKLRNLITLMLIGCRFYGHIPDSIGSLQGLVYISLASNRFTGPIPPSIGRLSNLSWLDVSYNQLNGIIPISNETAPGLDMLYNARHFHFSSNQLSGPVPDQLFHSNMSLIHAMFDNNKLTGNLPRSLGFVRGLEVIRFDWNSLDGSIPSNLNNLTSLNELYLSNNNFNGNIPNLTGLSSLFRVDVSNNSFDASEFPEWLSTLQYLTTIRMENTRLQGQIPVSVFELPQLETLYLSNNNFNGTLDIGSNYSTSVILELKSNRITDFRQSPDYRMNITLVGNPVCNANGARFCSADSMNNRSNILVQSNNCHTRPCNGNRVLGPNCQCLLPYHGTLNFFSCSFSNLQDIRYYTYLNEKLRLAFVDNGLPVDSVIVRNPEFDMYDHLIFPLQVFPLGQDSFNETSISRINFVLNRQSFNLAYYGPFHFTREASRSRSFPVGVIVGVTVSGSVLLILIFLVGIYALRQKRKAKRAMEMSNPFAAWDPDKGNGAVPQLQGVKCFSFEDLRTCTNNFSETNCIGAGGYGKVYKGTIASSQVVAIKRAQKGSMQGAFEFKTEIELLSRIHHKNVVSLVGFCFDHGEQMLVYEYVSNGTLQDCLREKSGFGLEWNRRVRIALDAARGLQYLHELADPPIIHRDIKSTNILLDSHFIAKVADFGLSKLLGDSGKQYVSTQVKGTLGYLDPEYFMSEQLTEKSDVYSFGIVLLELITGRPTIQTGKHIARLVQNAIKNERLDQIIDPTIESREKMDEYSKFINLAMSCVRGTANERPSMRDIVREIENIMELTFTRARIIPKLCFLRLALIIRLTRALSDPTPQTGLMGVMFCSLTVLKNTFPFSHKTKPEGVRNN